MKKLILMLILIMTASLMFASCAGSQTYEQESEKIEANILVDKSRLVIEDMLLSLDDQVPSEMIAQCSGIVIIPGMVKGGFFLGGSHGSGVVLARHGDTFSGPAFISLTAGSLGLQFGVQMADIILVIYGQKTMDSFLLNSQFKLGGEMAMVAGPVGAQTSAAADIMMNGGIVSYSRARGLFVGVSLEGAGISHNRNRNAAYYGSVEDPTQILSNPNMMVPNSTEQLINSLQRASKKGDQYRLDSEARKARNAEIEKEIQALEQQRRDLLNQQDALQKQKQYVPSGKN